jgi:hypothetical protein
MEAFQIVVALFRQDRVFREGQAQSPVDMQMSFSIRRVPQLACPFTVTRFDLAKRIPDLEQKPTGFNCNLT